MTDDVASGTRGGDAAPPPGARGRARAATWKGWRSSARSWRSSRSSSSRPIAYVGLPQPLPRAARRRQRLRRPRRTTPTLFTDAAVLGGLRAGRRCSSLVQVPIMLGLALVAALAIDSARLHGVGLLPASSIFLPYAVPAVVAVLMWGFMYGDQLRPRRRTSTTCSASRCIPPLARELDPRVDRQHRDLGVRRLQHADLLLGAAHGARPRSTRPPRSTAPGRSAIDHGRSSCPALRGAIVIATIFSIIGSFQLFNEPNILRTLAPNVITTLLHAEPVRLQPVVRRPAVQLLGHGRDRHGRASPRSSPTSCSCAAPEGGAMSMPPCRRVRPRPPRRRAAPATRVRRSPLRPRKSVALTLLMASSCSTAWCRWSGCSSTRPRRRATCSRASACGSATTSRSSRTSGDTLTYDDGIFLRWLGNTLLYVVVGAGGATAARDARRLRPGEVPTSPAGARSSPSCSARSPCPAPRSPCRRS